MIISRGRRYIFVHAPKTGGTAMTLALEARAMRDDILIGDTPKARARRRRLDGLQAEGGQVGGQRAGDLRAGDLRAGGLQPGGPRAAGRLWKHSTLADIDGLVSPREVDAFFVFTLVRNPWDRMVSYYHWLRAQRFAHPAVALAQGLDFSGFLNAPLTAESFRAAPYGAYVRRADGREKCDLFLPIEAPEAGIARLEAHLGLRLPPLPRVNESARARDWRPYYTDRDAALLAGIAAEDIARFGYRFDPSAPA